MLTYLSHCSRCTHSVECCELLCRCYTPTSSDLSPELCALFFSSDALWQQTLSASYPFYARLRCPDSLHLPPAGTFRYCFINFLLQMLLFLRRPCGEATVKRRIYKERLSASEPAGFRLRNSQVEAPVLPPDWRKRRDPSRGHGSGEATVMGGRGLRLLSNRPMGACGSSVTQVFVWREPSPKALHSLMFLTLACTTHSHHI